MVSGKGSRVDVALRPATGADLPAIKAMICEFADYLNAIDEPDALDPSLAGEIRTLAFGTEPLCRIEIAEVGGAPVGYMTYFIAIDMDGFAPALYIADLFVRDAWRERGVGRALMDRAASITRERGGGSLFWAVWNKNRTALAFYRRLGAQPWDEEILMRWDIGGTGSAAELTVDVDLRRATEADLPAVKAMIHEFADYLNAIDEPEELDPALVARIRNLAFGPAPLCSIEIAEMPGGPVGYMVHFTAVNMDGYAPALYIADLFVRDGWRKRGVGRALMDRAASIAREHGGRSLFWTVWRKNPKALAFYRRLGAEPWDEAILMRWDIGGNE